MRFLWLCSNTTNIVPRLAEANDHIPAYVDNVLAWGSKPIAVSMRRALLQRIARKILLAVLYSCFHSFITRFPIPRSGALQL